MGFFELLFVVKGAFRNGTLILLTNKVLNFFLRDFQCSDEMLALDVGELGISIVEKDCERAEMPFLAFLLVRMSLRLQCLMAKQWVL